MPSWPESPNSAPCSVTRCSRSAVSSSAFDGMQPRFRHVPPSRSRSTRPTDQPELRGADGADVAHAAAEDEQVEALRFGHQLRRAAGRAATGLDGAALVGADARAPLVGHRHRSRDRVVVGDEHRLRLADEPRPSAPGGHAVAHRDARAADAVHPGLDRRPPRRTWIGERKSSSTRARISGSVDRSRLVRLEDVEQVPDPGLLDVAEEDGVVDVPEGIDVAEAHLQRRAVAEVIGHGGPF